MKEVIVRTNFNEKIGLGHFRGRRRAQSGQNWGKVHPVGSFRRPPARNHAENGPPK